jgi:hypothetical protein
MHLITLGMVLERDMDPADAPAVHARMTNRPQFTWLDPPPMAGRLSVLDVLGARDPDEHERRVRAWGADVWRAWEPHHDQVWEWFEVSLGG